MKFYKVIKEFTVPCGTRDQFYDLTCLKDAQMLYESNSMFKWYQTTVFERIDPDDMPNIKEHLEEFKPTFSKNILKDISQYNFKNELTKRSNLR